MRASAAQHLKKKTRQSLPGEMLHSGGISPLLHGSQYKPWPSRRSCDCIKPRGIKVRCCFIPQKKKYFLSDRLNVCTLCIQGGIFFYRSLFGSNLVFTTSLECHKRTIFDTTRQISAMVVTVFIAAYQHIINKLLVRIQSDKVNSRCDGIPPVGPS